MHRWPLRWGPEPRKSALGLGALMLGALVLGSCAGRGASSPDPWTLPICRTARVGVGPQVLKDRPLSWVRNFIRTNGWLHGDSVEVVPVGRGPEIRDARALARAIRAAYPRDLHDRGMEGAPEYAVLVAPEGEVVEVQVVRGAASFGFNPVGARVLMDATFTPAVYRGCRVYGWTIQATRFTIR